MILEFAISTAMTNSGMTTGASDTAQFVAEKARESRLHVERSHTFGAGLDRARQELCQIAEECSQPNWDGYGAEPVSADAYRHAYLFLEALTLGNPLPTVGAEPDGHVTLEWHRGARRTLSVSVSPDGDLHYAALMGPNKAFGTEAFFGDVPKAISDLIQRVCAA